MCVSVCVVCVGGILEGNWAEGKGAPFPASSLSGGQHLGGKEHSSTGMPPMSTGRPEIKIEQAAAAFSGLSLTWRRRQPSSTWGSDSAHSWIACMSGARRCMR